MSVTGSVDVGERRDDAAGRGRTAPEVRHQLLSEASLERMLRAWLEGAQPPRDPRCLVTALNRHVALIDHLIDDQVNAILHHPDFQRLEASWRGLAFLRVEYYETSLRPSRSKSWT